MLQTFKKSKTTSTAEEIKAGILEKRTILATQQQAIKVGKLPVFVILDGWGSAGKGTLIGNLIKDLDPRFFNVFPIKAPTEEEKRKPFLWRYVNTIPEQGKFAFLDSGWMEEIISDYASKRTDLKTYNKRIDEIKIFERQLYDNSYLVVKIFLDIPEKEQKKRIAELDKKDQTRWRVGENDIAQIKDHEKYAELFNNYIDATNTEKCPWHIIDSSKKKPALYEALTILTDAIQDRLEHPVDVGPYTKNMYELVKVPQLSEYPLDQQMTKEEYSVKLKELQKKLKSLHNELYHAKIPVIIAYEGWDAAGKGGNIKRLTNALDPRGFEVFPIASPLPHEKARHFLWRFWTRLPKDGHIAIYDRTWYGRVMVERLEGFCTENDWKRAYNEINEFEYSLNEWGAIVIKFWVQIDKDTQLARFTERQNTPEKQWKITDEDWRNREKWDQYESAINEMIEKTSTKFAPWHVIPSNNKYYARIKAIETVIEEIEKRL